MACRLAPRLAVSRCVVSLLVAFVADALCLAGALRASGAAAQRDRQAVTPVQKVVELLGQLHEQISEEGKDEAAQYDKFACFCKEQQSNKEYAIGRSNEKIDTLAAEIEALDADIATLNNEVAQLGSQINSLGVQRTGEINTSSVAQAEHAVNAKNLTDAIAAIQGAIDSLQASKDQLKGAKLDLGQVRAAVEKRLSALQLGDSLRFNGAAGGLQSPPAYTYSANDIISTLQELLATFKRNLKALDETEFQRRSMSDKTLLALANEAKFKAQSKADKEQLVGSKTESKYEAEAAKLAETKARDADTAFQTELVAQCQAKATEFDQRSQARAGELTALAEAMEALRTGVVPNYGANKKLVGLQRHVAAPAVAKEPPTQGRLEAWRPFVGAPAFLQMHAVTSVEAAAVLRRAVKDLNEAAKRFHSPALAAMAASVAMQEGAARTMNATGGDYFVKVRGLIKDLISKLEADAAAEATSKSFCDEEMAKAVTKRDDQKLAMESQSTKISEEKAKKAALAQEVVALAEEIADLNKALNEAATLRAKEEAGNNRTVKDAGVGKAEIERAISILQAYYASQGAAPTFLQRAAVAPAPAPAGYTPYVAPNSDREGMTVGDRAPELTYAGEYRGAQESATGIIGLLQVILSDFDRTMTVVGSEESVAEAQYAKFVQDTEAAISAKSGEKTGKESDITTADGAIVQAQDSLNDATNLHESALQELEKLKAMCVDGEESWDERKAQREKEIEALKEALRLLDSWQD